MGELGLLTGAFKVPQFAYKICDIRSKMKHGIVPLRYMVQFFFFPNVTPEQHLIISQEYLGQPEGYMD